MAGNPEDFTGSGNLAGHASVRREAGRTFVKCFTARDMHASSFARHGCSSAPLCIQIRIAEVASFRGVLGKIVAPVASLDAGFEMDESVEILVDWTPPVWKGRGEEGIATYMCVYV